MLLDAETMEEFEQAVSNIEQEQEQDEPQHEESQDETLDDKAQDASSEEDEGQKDEEQDTPAESDTESDEPENETAEEEEPKNQHRVRYERFKQVIDARNAYEAEAQAAKKELEELKARLDAKAPDVLDTAPQKEEDVDVWLDKLLSDESAETTNPDVESLRERLDRLEQERQAEQLAAAQAELDREVAEAREKFPEVEAIRLYDAVSKHQGISVMKVAESISTSRVAYNEQVIANYLAEQAKAKEPAVPPRGRSKSSVAPTRESFKKIEELSTIKDASEALRQYLDSRG